MAIILGIESSCDETAVAIVENGRKVLANAVSSQMAKHALYGGVVPELAAREHLTAVEKVCSEALAQAGMSMEDVDAVAVTHAPGLVPALLVGLNFAKGLADAWKKPLIGINHFIAHIYGAFLEEEDLDFSDPSLYPMVALVVSGGHTSIVRISMDGCAEVLGTTIDDAAGEALDKGAKLLNLGYPGGPVIERLSQGGDPKRFAFPRSLTGAAGRGLDPENRYNFSFSGVKTSLLYHTSKYANTPDGLLEGELLRDTLASYQEAVADVLCIKAFDAVKESNAGSAVLCGGVACNSRLRELFAQRCPENVRQVIARKKYCTDNGAMVAALAYHYYKAGIFQDQSLDAVARLPRITQVPFGREENAPKPEPGCVIFDLDGTIINSLPDIAAGVNSVRKFFGLSPLPQSKIAALTGNGVHDLMSRSLADKPDVDLEKAVALMQQYYIDHGTDYSFPYEGVQEGLALLRKNNWKTALFSNKPAPGARAILRNFGLLDSFDLIIGGGEGFPLKPDGAAIVHILEKLGTPKENSWMVGDNWTDLDSGKNAGVRSCFAEYGFGERKKSAFTISAASFPAIVRMILASAKSPEEK